MGSDEVDEEKGNLVQYQQTIELPDGAIQRNKTIESFLETEKKKFSPKKKKKKKKKKS